MSSIDKILEGFTFAKRKVHRNLCKCYRIDKPCHSMPENELNCCLCYCPYYPKDGSPCKIEGNKGKYIPSKDKKVWDCSDCTINHTKEFIEKYLSLK